VAQRFSAAFAEPSLLGERDEEPAFGPFFRAGIRRPTAEGGFSQPL
jgi:hypothetical protein